MQYNKFRTHQSFAPENFDVPSTFYVILCHKFYVQFAD